MFETTTVLTLHLAKAMGLYMLAGGLSGRRQPRPGFRGLPESRNRLPDPCNGP